MATKRLEYLDSLRAIAALLVVWLHVTEEFIRMPGVREHGSLLYDMASSVDFGRIGVITFFAISGFIIPQSIRGDRATGTKKFLVSRFFRLFPAYWLSVPLALVVLWWLPGREISGLDVAGNFTMLESILGYQPLMGHYWTLEIELIFYTLCLLLFQLNLVHRIETSAFMSALMVLIFIAATSGLLRRWFHVELDLPSNFTFMAYNLGIMFWGSCAQHCLLGPSKKTSWILLALCTALVFFPPVWALVHITEASREGVIRFVGGYGLGLALFVLGVTVLKIRVAWLAWLGVISYSLYLFHPIVFYGLIQLINYFDISVLQGRSLAVYLALATGLSILLAWLVYRLVERPSIALGRKLSYTIPH